MCCAGGELLDAVIEKGHYSEDDARKIFVQIMDGIQYLHSRSAPPAAAAPYYSGGRLGRG